MPKTFPKTMMGQCPLCSGGGAGPDEDAGSAFSTTQIEAREDVPLEYSSVYDDYVCILHRRQAGDELDDEKFSERDRRIEQKRQKMGFKTTYTTN